MCRWGGEMAWIHIGHGNLQKRTDIYGLNMES